MAMVQFYMIERRNKYFQIDFHVVFAFFFYLNLILSKKSSNELWTAKSFETKFFLLILDWKIIFSCGEASSKKKKIEKLISIFYLNFSFFFWLSIKLIFFMIFKIVFHTFDYWMCVIFVCSNFFFSSLKWNSNSFKISNLSKFLLIFMLFFHWKWRNFLFFWVFI